MGRAATIYLVRHAKAGERRSWNGDDFHRPLSKKGHRQSDAVARRLSKRDVSALHSSEYLRCVQTLEPLGKLLDLPVQLAPCLTEDEPVGPVLDFIRSVDDGAVLCSHGDIIPATIDALSRDGMRLETPPNWGKAGVWVLQRTGKRMVSGKVWPPPDLAARKR